MKDHETYPLIAITSGKGAWLCDDQGRRFIDGISSWWTNLFGHANPRINQAIADQLHRIEHVMLAGFTHQPVVELSERLSALTNGQLGHAFYASDGASAVEIALKMSHHFWKIQGKPNKKEFICLANSYHGETLGALSVTDVSIFRDAYGSLLNPVHIVMSPDSRATTDQISSEEVINLALKNLEECLAQHHQTIAALIIEPLVQCAGQMAMHAPRYVKGAKQLCEQYDVHLIADEIAVGCGRTGTFFACEQAGIWPDLMTLSKGISAGYLPLSICLSTDAIYSAFYSDHITATFLHSHSYTGNPLACRAALAGLDIFQEDAVLEMNKVRSQWIHEAFLWTRDHRSIEHVRQQGMIMAFDVKASAISNPGSFSKAMFQQGLCEGVLIRPIGRTVYVMPPYILSADEVQQMSRAIERTLHAVLQKV
jgi:adenosylmethionine-8-amino-7-oxononanoate aminotransferase